MREEPSESSPPLKQVPALLRRWLFKTLLFAAFTLVVLNPNLKRAFLQVGHTLYPEQLIQTRFAGLPGINAEVDQVIATDAGAHSEARLVAKFVLKRIKYVSDYENWGNVEYWPTAEETWRLGQEDCDGRAILCTSILRSRGFSSARMVVGLDHMWVKVNENEKNPSKPPHTVALLSPNPDFSLDLPEQSGWEEFVAIFKALLHPAAFWDTVKGIIGDIPVLRKVALALGLMVVWCLPIERGARWSWWTGWPVETLPECG